MPITRQTYFQPTQITGCSLWLDGADNSTIYSSYPGTLAGNTSTVTRWNDKSGANNHVYQNGAATCPTFTLASNALNFAGGGGLWNSVGYALSSNVSFFTVMISPGTGWGTWGTLWGHFRSGSHDSDIQFRQESLTNGYVSWHTNNNNNNYLAIPTAGTKVMYSCTMSNGVNMFLQNSYSGSTTSVTYTEGTMTIAGGTVAPFWVGRSDSSEVYNGYICEIVYYNQKVSDTQRQQVETYLAQKWGLTSSLPTGHPGLTSIVYRNLQTTFTKNQYYTAFSPKQIGACALWLDGADPAGTGVLPANNSTLATWTDKSGNGNNATQSTAGSRPSFKQGYLNGNGSIYFTTTNNMLLPSLTIGPLTIFVVAKLVTYGNNNFFLSLGQSPNAIFVRAVYNPAYFGVDGYGTYITTTNSDTNYHIFSYTQGSTASFWFDGSPVSVGSVVPTQTGSYTYTNQNTIGGWNAFTNSVDSVISEILIFNTPILTTTQRQQVESYLAQKWGLVSSLPTTGHIQNTFPAGSPTAIQPYTTSVKTVITSVLKVLTMINAFPISINNWQCTFVSSDASFIVAFANGPYTIYCGYPYTSLDKGITFTAQKSAGQISWYYCAGSDNGSTLISAEYGAQLYVSVNSGVTMTAQTSLGNKTWSGYACSSNASLLVAVASGSGIYTSTNQGTSWTTTSAGASNWNWCCCSGDGTYVYTTLANSYVYKSSNSGSTWSALTGSGARNWQGICCSKDGSKIYGTAYNGYIYFSSDYGATWASQSVSTTWGPICCSYDGTKAFAAVSPGLIYATINSGGTWTTNIVNNTLTSEGWKGISCSADGTFALVASWGNSPSTGLLYKIIYK